MELKAITIDFWNTMFDNSNGQKRNEFRMRSLFNEIDKFGISVKAEEFNTAMKASWEYFNDVWKNQMRTPLPAETAVFFWQKLGLPENEEGIKNLTGYFADAVLKFPPKPIEGVPEALDKLSQKFSLGIVSDTGFTPGVALRQLLEIYDMKKYFTSFSFSDETGVSKPHPKAFETALEGLDCLPEQSLHIGDIEDTDIVGAKRMGMKSIRFSGDPSTTALMDNPKTSVADYEMNSWDEIVGLLYT
ncbi:MAG: HAD family hydrolase [Bacteroidota bacterium]